MSDLREAIEVLEKLLASLTTVQGTEMDAVLGPEYRLHGIHLSKAEAFLRRAREAYSGDGDTVREALMDVLAHLVSATSLLERGGKKAAASDKMFTTMLQDYNASIERGRAVIHSLSSRHSPMPASEDDIEYLRGRIAEVEKALVLAMNWLPALEIKKEHQDAWHNDLNVIVTALPPRKQEGRLVPHHGSGPDNL